MSDKKKLAPILALTLVAGMLLGFLITGALFVARVTEFEIARPQHWPPNIKRYANIPASTIRVVDSESGVTLFSYHDDAAVTPELIEKTENGKWRVTFVLTQP